VVIYLVNLERGADLQMAQLIPLPLSVSRFSKIQLGFTFLVPKRVRVCVCVCVCVEVGNQILKCLRDEQLVFMISAKL